MAWVHESQVPLLGTQTNLGRKTGVPWTVIEQRGLGLANRSMKDRQQPRKLLNLGRLQEQGLPVYAERLSVEECP